jgi:hypothetical protein
VIRPVPTRPLENVFYLFVLRIQTAARWLRPLRAFMAANSLKLIVRARVHQAESIRKRSSQCAKLVTISPGTSQISV